MLEQWDRELALSCSASTRRAYVGAVRQLADHAGKPPEDLTRSDVIAWLAQDHLGANSRALTRTSARHGRCCPR